MIKIKSKIYVCFVFSLAFCAELVKPVSLQAEDIVIEMTLYPSRLAVPAMEYRLMTPASEKMKSNAVGHYRRAMNLDNVQVYDIFQKQTDLVMDGGAELKKFKEGKVDDSFQRWIDSEFLYELEQASLCAYSDWQIPLEKFHIATNLNEQQNMRHIARVIASFIRWHVAHGRYEEAIRMARTGVMLSTHMTDGVIIQSLIGDACLNMISAQLQVLMSQPESPNLYWAFSEVVSEIPSAHFLIEFERKMLDSILPDIPEMENRVFTESEIRVFTKKFIEAYQGYHGKAEEQSVLETQVALWVLSSYPSCREVLEESGYSAEKIDSMPTLQVVLLGQYLPQRILFDDFEKCFLLPPHEGLKLVNQIAKVNARELYKKFPKSKFNLVNMFPSGEYFFYSHLRKFQRLEMYKTVELIRDYIAQNEKLPESLADLDSILLPKDPATGKDFEYKSEGKSAVLSAVDGGYGRKIVFRLKLGQ